MPDLHFHIERAEPLTYAAAPSLLFKLRIENSRSEPVRSIMLRVQIQIETAQRHYSEQEQARLHELFGPPQRWGQTLKPMLWTHAVVLVPPFEASSTVDVPVTCTYDFEVASAKYFHALDEGTIPLTFLFSGTVFYDGAMGLQAEQISWEKEATFRLPVDVWRTTMDHYFPHSAWLRLHKDIFNRLHAYKAARGLVSWEETVEALLEDKATGH